MVSWYVLRSSPFSYLYPHVRYLLHTSILLNVSFFDHRHLFTFVA